MRTSVHIGRPARARFNKHIAKLYDYESSRKRRKARGRGTIFISSRRGGARRGEGRRGMAGRDEARRGERDPRLIDGESNGDEVGGFRGGSLARMGIIFNKDPRCPALTTAPPPPPPSSFLLVQPRLPYHPSSPFNLHEGFTYVTCIYRLTRPPSTKSAFAGTSPFCFTR